MTRRTEGIVLQCVNACRIGIASIKINKKALFVMYVLCDFSRYSSAIIINNGRLCYKLIYDKRLAKLYQRDISISI